LDFASNLIKDLHPSSDVRDPKLIDIILKNQAVRTWFRHSRPQVALSDTKRIPVNPPIDPLVSLHPQSASLFSTNDFARESLARTLLEKVPSFVAGLGFDEWIQEVLSKIPLDWPCETKINIIKAKLHVSFQALLTWELAGRSSMTWEKFMTILRKSTSSSVSDVLKRNQIRDLRQSPGQSFSSWISTVSTVFHSIHGDLPSEDVARKLIIEGASPAYQIRLERLRHVTSIQKLLEKIEHWEASHLPTSTLTQPSLMLSSAQTDAAVAVHTALGTGSGGSDHNLTADDKN